MNRSPHGTVFHYPWWLESVESDYDILVVRDKSGALSGGIPLPRQCRFGLRLLHAPDLTPYLGPVFDLTSADNNCDRLYLMRYCGEILARSIGPFDSFRCLAGATAPDLQGFLWAGFRVGLYYTFRFPAFSSLEDVEASMTRTHAQKLAKARRLNLTVVRDEGLEELILLNRMTFQKQGLTPPYPSALLARVWTAAHARGHAHLYVARTAGGVPAAALLTVHDRHTTYQIVSGVHSEMRDVPGAYLALWHALRDALAAGRHFDFEGSSLRGVERFYRRWGPAAVPVWRMEKAGSWRGALFQFLINRRDKAVYEKGRPESPGTSPA